MKTLSSKLLGVVALSAAVTLSSCNKDDDGNGAIPKNEAQSAITAFNTKAKSDLQELSNAEGMAAVQDFFSLTNTDDPFSRIATTDKNKVRAFLHKRGQSFKSIFGPAGKASGRTQGSEPFDFDSHKGVYVWNSKTEAFELTDEANNIRILFPTEGSTTNDAELILSAYAEVEINNEEGTSYEPSILKASVKHNGTVVASLDLNITWDEAGFPLTADITASTAPFSYNISFDVSGSTTNTLAISVTKNQETLLATSIAVNYKDTSKSEESLKNIDGYVQFLNMKLQGTINVEAANQSNVNWNDIVKLALYADGKKLGDVIMVDENQETVAYLQYADGSKEKLETVLQPVIDELNALGEDLKVNG